MEFEGTQTLARLRITGRFVVGFIGVDRRLSAAHITFGHENTWPPINADDRETVAAAAP
jgi:hypothetical protein